MLSCTSACNILFKVVKRIAVWSQLKCSGSRPYSRMVHHEEFLLQSSVSNPQCSLLHCQQPLLDGIVHLYALLSVGGSPDLTCMHASWDCVRFEESNLGMQSVGKVVFLNKLFGSERASCEWSQSCISCNIQVVSFVTHRAQI